MLGHELSVVICADTHVSYADRFVPPTCRDRGAPTLFIRDQGRAGRRRWHLSRRPLLDRWEQCFDLLIENSTLTGRLKRRASIRSVTFEMFRSVTSYARASGLPRLGCFPLTPAGQWY